MAAFMMKKPMDTIVKSLAGLGATNVGASLLNFDVLSLVPAGIAKTVAVGAIGLSGIYVLQLVFNKKI